MAGGSGGGGVGGVLWTRPMHVLGGTDGLGWDRGRKGQGKRGLGWAKPKRQFET